MKKTCWLWKKITKLFEYYRRPHFLWNLQHDISLETPFPWKPSTCHLIGDLISLETLNMPSHRRPHFLENPQHTISSETPFPWKPSTCHLIGDPISLKTFNMPSHRRHHFLGNPQHSISSETSQIFIVVLFFKHWRSFLKYNTNIKHNIPFSAPELYSPPQTSFYFSLTVHLLFP